MEYLNVISLFSKAYSMNWIEYWREIGLLASPIVGWFIGRKSNAIKLRTEGADSIAALQKIYDKYIDHNSQVTEELRNRVTHIESNHRELQKNFNDLQMNYSIVLGNSLKFEEKYNLLTKEYEQLRIDYEKLKLAFDKYKKENKNETN